MSDYCGDNGCVFGNPAKGMSTNGGCCCTERQMRRGVMRLRARVAELEAKYEPPPLTLKQRADALVGYWTPEEVALVRAGKCPHSVGDVNDDMTTTCVGCGKVEKLTRKQWEHLMK